MIRRIPAPWLVLDIVGAIVGLLITVPLSLTFSGGQLSFWMPDPPSAVMLVAVSMLLWGAAAISRLSPPIALVVAWTGALLQMAAGLPPLPLDLAIFVVLFAAAAWGTKRMMWIGGASAVGGGLIAGVYIGVLQYDFTAAVTAPSPIEMRLVLLSITMGLTIVLSLAMAWGAGLLWRLVRQSRANREAQLRAETAAAEEQERVRIARDMHDIVAHSLAVVIAQSDGARYAAAARPELAQEALTTIAQTARSALSDVRMLLTQLRHRQGDGPQPTLADLETLFAQVRQAGVEPRVSVDPMPQAEPPGAVQLAVYRILQEALTNAIRHGEGDVDVRLSWWADRVDLLVHNRIAAVTTAADASTSAHGGHGLIGMRERAQLMGGTLTVQHEPSRFTVRATLPIGPSAN
ncbi:histidine kinase [Microbacterium sp. NPDC077391]|uniref:sensor histidine kinase n=1 Tax=Microbacterium sp. NPDC077391 TaxID=3154765 RepID=UPI00341F7CB6